MKYANQLNILVSIVGFLVLLYAFSSTFWDAEPLAALDIQPVSVSTRAGGQNLDLSPMMRGAVTTQESALESMTDRRRATTSRPVWRGDPSALTPETRTRGATVDEGLPATLQNQMESRSTFPAQQPAGTVLAPPSGPRPAPTGFDSDPGETSTVPGERRNRISRRIPPPSPEVESEKRDSSQSPPPPVRSSMQTRRRE